MVGPSINTRMRNAVSLVRGSLRLAPIITVVESFEKHTVKLGIDTKHYLLVISDNKHSHTHTNANGVVGSFEQNTVVVVCAED